MVRSERHSLAGIACLLLCLCSATVLGAEPALGKRPGYLTVGPSSVPNQQAVTRMIWAPGLDDGYVPQGLAFAEGALIMTGYRSTEPKVGRGPCRLFRIDAKTGEYTGHADMPEDCGHAGGVVSLGRGIVVVSDTRRLYKIDVNKAFADGHVKDALLATVRLTGELKGSFIAFDGTDLWTGSSEKDVTKAALHQLSLKVFDEFNGKSIREDKALATLPIGAEAQGAAFDKTGGVWVTYSNSRFGSLHKLDAKTGGVTARHDMVIGIENITFDDAGSLWAVSEAGSRRWIKWPATFPLMFQMELSRLR